MPPPSPSFPPPAPYPPPLPWPDSPSALTPSPPAHPPTSPYPGLPADGQNCSIFRSLAGDVTVQLSAPRGVGALVLGNGSVEKASGVDAAEQSRSFSQRWGLGSEANGVLQASVQGHEFLRASQQTALAPARHISAVLRTSAVYVDRREVIAAYQLRDGAGSVRVSLSGLQVVMTVSLEGESGVSTACDLSAVLDPSRYFVGTCRAPSLPQSWFVESASATVSLQLRQGAQVLESAAVAGLRIERQPSWFGALHEQLDSAAAFCVLPVRPLFALEEFEVGLYAHTGGFALDTFWVWLYFDQTKLEFLSFVQNELFQTVAQDLNPAGDAVRFSTVGLRGSTEDSMVTSSSLHLVTAKMRFRAGVSVGAHSGGLLSAYTRQFINPGGNVYLEDAAGVVLDARGGGNVEGELVLRDAVDRGIFAYAPPRLANLAALTGEGLSYGVTAVSIRESLAGDETAVASSVSCESGVSAAVLELSGCTIRLSAAQSQSDPDAAVTVVSNGFERVLRFDVYSPQDVQVDVADAELNLVDGVGECGAEERFQQTSVSAAADGLDVSPLVSFSSTDASVASVHSHTLLRGLSVGSARIFLAGRDVSFAAALVQVSNVSVSAVRLLGRLVTGAEWMDPPPSQLVTASFRASLVVAQRLLVEGSSGLLFALLEWSDGFVEDVAAGALNVSSLTSGLEVVSPLLAANGATHWSARVATGAEAACGDLLHVRHVRCGAVLASAGVPVHIDVPEATGVAVELAASRLTPQDDDAARAPISVQSETRVRAFVSFADGSRRDLSSDARVSFNVSSDACAEVVVDGPFPVLRVRPGAACDAASVTARFGSFEGTASVPVVRAVSMAVVLGGYPDSASNRQLALSTLGQVQCATGEYHHATAHAEVRLSGSVGQRDYAVSADSSFVATDTTVARISGLNRVVPLSAGATHIGAAFGSSMRASVSLTVVDEVVAPVEAVSLSTELKSAQTLRLEAGARQALTASLEFADGVVFTNVRLLDWLSVSSLLAFSSSAEEVASASAEGFVTLHANSAFEVAITATMRCEADASSSVSFVANLEPAEGDVDFGQVDGVQFVQSGALLPIA
eukprot:1252598-Pleurochrysis_carterae.AAC.1